MKKNLNSKIALIVAVLAICVYGIFGVPSGLTGKDLGEAMTKRIHLAWICARRSPDLASQGARGCQRRNRQHRGAAQGKSERRPT